MAKQSKSSPGASAARNAGSRKTKHAARGDKTGDGPTTPAQYRSEIKRLDKEIVSRLSERARLVQRAHQQNLNVPNLSDSSFMGSSVAKSKSPWLPEAALRTIFREIVGECRQLVQAVEVAYLGPAYSYSHLAAARRFGESAQLAPVNTIAAVFQAVDREDVQWGVVPLENSTDGRIADTMEMLASSPLRISGEVQLRIHHNLLGKCRRDEIRVVCSKPQALSQCRSWLGGQLPDVRIDEMASTTAAAERAAREQSVAAVASVQAGRHYGLNVIASRIEDNRENVTRFAVIGREMADRTGNDVTSLMFQLSHKPGALAEAMNIFKRNRLNLTWIESFPMSGCPSEYLFFVELEGHPSDLRVRRAVQSLQNKTEQLETLGAFARMEPVD